jgi:hypothetical protein
MAVGPDQRLTPEERANLVAYIDGELTEAESRAITTKLSLSPVARREVESLKKTWAMLDVLPRPKATPDLTERTLTSIRTYEARGLSYSQTAGAWLSQLAKLSVSLIVAAAALGAGFALTRWVWPDATSRLARDLSLAEHLEEYQEVSSFDLLDELVKSREFGRPGF